MQLVLGRDTTPEGLLVEVQGMDETVVIGEYKIKMADFLSAVYFVLTSTNLTEEDPRLQFVRCVQAMKVDRGRNLRHGTTMPNNRLTSRVSPVFCR